MITVRFLRKYRFVYFTPQLSKTYSTISIASLRWVSMEKNQHSSWPWFWTCIMLSWCNRTQLLCFDMHFQHLSNISPTASFDLAAGKHTVGASVHQGLRNSSICDHSMYLGAIAHMKLYTLAVTCFIVYLLYKIRATQPKTTWTKCSSSLALCAIFSLIWHRQVLIL